MDFLSKVYFNNSVQTYLIVVGIIAVMMLAKHYLSHTISWLLCRLGKSIWRNFDEKSFTRLIVKPLSWFLFIVISIFALDKLQYPKEVDSISLYGHPVEQIIERIGIGLIIIAFTRFLLRIIDFIALALEQKALKTEDKTDDQLVIFFRDFLKVIANIVGVLMLIKACFNQSVGGVITSLSIVGAAVALAAKESLENLIASFIIFFDKPFSAGDTVKANDITGTVERIGLRSTRIRTGDKTLVTIPNKMMVDSIVDNHTLRTYRRSEIKLELSAATSSENIQKVMGIIKSKLEADNNITSSTIHLTDMGRNGITVALEFFTNLIAMEDFVTMKEQYFFFIKKILEDYGVTMSGNNSLTELVNKLGAR
ncbi:MAG: mechanosensitive ion channel family protein [Bacteroidetes bacterium]|nr:mechanosensitive ion channel family protein [Bacteroidota bacterium]